MSESPWDRGTLAVEIDRYWRTDTREQAHREALAALVAQYAPRGAVLDAGCGSGLLALALAARGWGGTYVGCDTSARMLELARARVPGEVVAADLSALPFPDLQFDLVVCTEVLVHLAPETLPVVLAELGRVARRRLLVTFWPVLDLAHEREEAPQPHGFYAARLREDVLVALVRQALPGRVRAMSLAALPGSWSLLCQVRP